MAAEARSSWSTILGGIRNTEPGKVMQHPNATLTAQADRVEKAHHAVVKLDIDVQANDAGFKSAVAEIEKHYTEVLDEAETKYRERAGDLSAKYSSAYEVLMREQRAFLELLKQLNCKAEFVNHFPVPKVESSDEQAGL